MPGLCQVDASFCSTDRPNSGQSCSNWKEQFRESEAHFHMPSGSSPSHLPQFNRPTSGSNPSVTSSTVPGQTQQPKNLHQHVYSSRPARNVNTSSARGSFSGFAPGMLDPFDLAGSWGPSHVQPSEQSASAGTRITTSIKRTKASFCVFGLEVSECLFSTPVRCELDEHSIARSNRKPIDPRPESIQVNSYL
ncbi:unnamed protein product [Protopolystoma xenopodis]|uniref:Uncharacterized protein n=1 Tax=Protopolystoma xenopodis TaxID=117903 RepID=A0A3S5FG36_9PLAT|nr:unnamed protein product [Protopolystoma xenopodis]